MNKHTLTVQFDDEKASVDQMVKALGKAGYTVPAYQKKRLIEPLLRNFYPDPRFQVIETDKAGSVVSGEMQ